MSASPQPLHVKRANRWRSQYNPLRALTLQRAVSLLELGERGQYADLAWTYRFIEKREPTLRGLKRLRLAALKQLDWNIKTVDDTPAAKQQADALRAAYDGIGNLRAALEFLSLAEFRGFSHLEKRYDNDDPAAPVSSLEIVPQWHWVREDLNAPWQYNAEAASTSRGTPIDPAHFIIREIDDPIDEIALICFLRKNLSQKDWDGFVETYGLPPLFIEMPPNTGDTKAEEYQAMAEAVIGDMRGTLPNGAKVQTADAGARGTNPFKEHLAYQDEQLVLAGTSGKLTMLNGPTGLGGGQSEVHQDVFDELAQAEAAEISEIFQAQFDRPILDAKFEGQPVLAYFELAAEDKTDVSQVLDDAVKASQAGYQIDAAELAEKTGYKLTLAPRPEPTPFGFGRPPVPPAVAKNRAAPEPATLARTAAFKASAVEQLTAAQRASLTPLVARLEHLANRPDAEFDAGLKQLQAELPRLYRTILSDPALAEAWEEIYGAALVSGATEAARQQQAALPPAAPATVIIQHRAPPPTPPTEVKLAITLHQPEQPDKKLVSVKNPDGSHSHYRTETIPLDQP